MEMCIKAEELRKALKDIEDAEENGFMHCLAVFRLASTGGMLSDNLLEYSDLWAKAHSIDGNLDWGRYSGVTRRYRFKNGELTEIFEVEKSV